MACCNRSISYPVSTLRCGRSCGPYIARPQVDADVSSYVVAPHFGDEAGLAGAFALAMLAAGVA